MAKRPAGGLEAAVLATLWAADRPLTPADVRAALDTDLAHTTVLTILARLHEKGVVTREAAGRTHAYAPLLDQAGIAAAKMRALLDGGPDRDAILSRFVDGLSGDEGAALADRLRAARRRGRRSGD